MSTCRIPYLIHGLYHRIYCRIIPDRVIRPVKIIIYRTGNPYNMHVMLLAKQPGPGKSSIPTDHHQGINSQFLHLLVSFRTPLRCTEFLAAGRLQDSTSALNNITYVMGMHTHNISCY